jgi:hypothetical protein
MLHVALVVLLVGARAFDVGVTMLDDPSACEVQANKGDELTVAYAGSIAESSRTGTPGAVFDSSSSFTFKLGVQQVIQGWDDGIQCLCKGARVKLTIPPELGYGSRGAGRAIPGGATLSFTVTLLNVNKCQRRLFMNGGSSVACPEQVACPAREQEETNEHIPTEPHGMRMHYTAGEGTKECAPWPVLELEDVQPKSQHYGEKYGFSGPPGSGTASANVTLVQLYYSD